ncbi:hypothetical protein Tsubulata_020845, partial [Turnera subulata]
TSAPPSPSTTPQPPSAAFRLSHHHFNTLLYLCSTSLAGGPDTKDFAVSHGFWIFDHMVSAGIKPNEASITAVGRLAAAKGDGDYAFDLVKKMGVYGAAPRLRTYDPALFCFCERMEAEKAYEVEEYMGAAGVGLEEPEIAALLRVSAECGKEEKECFRGFEGDGVELDGELVSGVVAKNGGGWHGLGWIGKGKWVVRRGTVDVDGVCSCCGERLVCVDIDDQETERFAGSVAGLALEREAMTNFSEFQDWLENHADYEAIVDGANIGLYQQNFAEGGFSIPQLDAVVKELYNRHGNKWPLIVLHNKRVRALLDNPAHRGLVQEWIEKDVLYTTPHGSNDDWYDVQPSLGVGRCGRSCSWGEDRDLSLDDRVQLRRGKESSFTAQALLEGKEERGHCWKLSIRMIIKWKLHFGGTWFHNRPEKPYVGGLTLEDEIGSDYVSLVEYELRLKEMEFFPPVEYFYKIGDESTKDLRLIENEMHLLRIVDSMEQRGIDNMDVFVKHAWNDHDIANEEAEGEQDGQNAAEAEEEANGGNAAEEVPNDSGGNNESEEDYDDYLPSEMSSGDDEQQARESMSQRQSMSQQNRAQSSFTAQNSSSRQQQVRRPVSQQNTENWTPSSLTAQNPSMNQPMSQQHMPSLNQQQESA